MTFVTGVIGFDKLTNNVTGRRGDKLDCKFGPFYSTNRSCWSEVTNVLKRT